MYSMMLKMDLWLLLILLLPLAKGDSSLSTLPPDGTNQRTCLDVKGLLVQPGENYVPGPDYCSVCKCEEGSPRFCRAVLCQPRQDCQSFRVGATCCDFICLDDVLPKLPEGGDGSDYPLGGENSLGVRLAAAILTALMAFVLLLFLVHRLRQRRLAAQQYVNAQDAACCHSAAYWHSSEQAQLFLHGGPPCPPWKPPSCTMDAPPPYTEADAQRAHLVAPGACLSSSTGAAGGRPGAHPPSSAPPSYCSNSGSAAALVCASAADSGNTAYGGRMGHSRNSSYVDTSSTQHRSPRDDDRDSAASTAVSVREQSGNVGPPASLGPLAVQLLPTGATGADLREQIQRQRQNLADHTARTLPRHGVGSQQQLRNSGDNGGDVSSHSSNDVSVKVVNTNLTMGRGDNSYHLSLVNTLPRVTSPTVDFVAVPTSEAANCSDWPGHGDGCDDVGAAEASSSSALQADHLHGCVLQGDDDNAHGGTSDGNYGEDETDTTVSKIKSTVRQSVMKFEAAAALEAADAVSQRSNSPATAPPPSHDSPQHPPSSLGPAPATAKRSAATIPTGQGDREHFRHTGHQQLTLAQEVPSSPHSCGSLSFKTGLDGHNFLTEDHLPSSGVPSVYQQHHLLDQQSRSPEQDQHVLASSADDFPNQHYYHQQQHDQINHRSRHNNLSQMEPHQNNRHLHHYQQQQPNQNNHHHQQQQSNHQHPNNWLYSDSSSGAVFKTGASHRKPYPKREGGTAEGVAAAASLHGAVGGSYGNAMESTPRRRVADPCVEEHHSANSHLRHRYDASGRDDGVGHRHHKRVNAGNPSDGFDRRYSVDVPRLEDPNDVSLSVYGRGCDGPSLQISVSRRTNCSAVTNQSSPSSSSGGGADTARRYHWTEEASPVSHDADAMKPRN